jgi:type IV secretory pathway ATPase VirB11/archaellum biosynthesis ATPase
MRSEAEVRNEIKKLQDIVDIEIKNERPLVAATFLQARVALGWIVGEADPLSDQYYSRIINEMRKSNELPKL